MAKFEIDQAKEYLRLTEELQRKLAARLSQVAAGDKPMSVFVLRRTEYEAQVLISKLKQQMLGKFDSTADEAIEMSVEHLGSELDQMSRAFDKQPYQFAPQGTKAFAATKEEMLSHFAYVVDGYGVAVANTIRQELFLGLRAGEPFGTVAQSLLDKGVTGTKWQATRIVRTEVNSAYNAAHLDSVKQLSEDDPSMLKMWWHTGSYPCPICIPLHKTTRKPGETWAIKVSKRKTSEVQQPPGHPNCVCTVRPMPQRWRKKLDALGALRMDAVRKAA